jgi:hypothetical protein
MELVVGTEGKSLTCRQGEESPRKRKSIGKEVRSSLRYFWSLVCPATFCNTPFVPARSTPCSIEGPGQTRAVKSLM